MKKGTAQTLIEKKKAKQPITWLTAHDYPMVQFEEKAGIDIILVGDSIGMTTYGFDSMLPVLRGNPVKGFLSKVTPRCNGFLFFVHPLMQD